jgi:phenylpropionate dioxygenase-like ring-hydroxylating dioxygenase large terminal subunit
MSDTLVNLKSEWLPAANATEIEPGRPKAIRLAGVDVVLWRDSSGEAHAWQDRCPHRGAKLSLGRVDGDVLVCGYHGWNYGVDGKCVRMPSHPSQRPPAAACATVYAACEKYGIVWVCLGAPARELDVFPEYDRPYPHVRTVHLKPQLVQTSALRLMENFLDMAHFPFVHTGTLGEEPRTEVKDYRVQATERGLVATNCLFWQPGALPALKEGAEIEYVYSVRAPMVATLTKLPLKSAGDGSGAMHLLLAIAPVEECQIRAWLVSVFENDPHSTDQQLYDFNMGIFMEDVPMVESQQPKWLPLEGTSELHQRCDQLAVSYRRWLKEIGWSYGTSLGAAATAERMKVA